MNKKEYFKDRGIEPKHYWMVSEWVNYLKPKKVLDVGCGRGPYLVALKEFEVECYGIDKSEEAIEASLVPNLVTLGDIKQIPYPDNSFDLVICIDVLEHLNLEEIPIAIKELIRVSNKYILCSICMVNEYGVDPNWFRDSTHKTLKSKVWWMEQFLYEGCELEQIPQDWLFWQQLLLFKIK